MTTIQTPITSTTLIQTAAEAAVLAKAAKKSSADLFTKAQADAIAVLTAAGVESVTLADGTKVSLKGGLDGETRRKVSATALAERIPATVLDKVTTRTVDLAAFDAAVKAGIISPEAAAAATTNDDVKPSLVITVPVTVR